jgi:hypothetical protein
MRQFPGRTFSYVLAVLCLISGRAARASDLDVIGATALQQADPTLTGAGIAVIQAEASLTSGTAAADDTFQTNPASAGLPAGIFTYINNSGSVANAFPNSAGAESSHADTVAANLAAVAPGIGSLDNYDGNFYYNSIVAAGQTPSSFNSALHNAQIVNQSFVFTGVTSAGVASIDKAYDSYAAANNVLFISAAGNSVSPPQAPATAYNGICVNAMSLSPSTSDATGGRSIIALTAPGNETSYSTPYVTGAAALLLQAADRGDGGAGSESDAGDLRTLKALLLNGATKPAGWSHTDAQPLDPVSGAGVVNVYQSWLELKAGQQTAAASTGANSALQPPASLPLSSGWDLGSLPNGATTNHYFFTAPAAGAGGDVLTATIDWNVTNWDGGNNAVFNNLDLALYDVTTNTPSLVSVSDSTLDNLQQLYVTGLAPGDTYDLRVYDASARVNGGAETYGLAYSAAGSSLAAVPEPSAIVLLAAAGACGLAAIARRRRR